MVSTGFKSGCCMGWGSILVVSAAIMAVFWPTLFFAQLKTRMILTPESMSFGLWREIPIPMYLECFFFNITNVNDILNRNATKIEVQQMGPYVFREFHTKENISWNDNNTVTYYNQRRWHYVPEMSNGSLADNVTSINPIIATVAYVMRHRSAIVNLPVDLFIRAIHDDLFLKANVSSWLFDGIDDRVIDIGSQFPNMPFEIPFDRFGWFYGRNNSLEYDGVFLMNTGAGEFSELGNIEKWKDSNVTVFRDECGVVKGSAGELWAPELGQPEVFIFAPDICTYLILPENKTVTVDGIEGVEYAVNGSVFDNGHNYPHMACYCAEERDNDCLPAGALNVSACRYGAPAFVSLPHFLDSDPYYTDKIIGLKPEESHRFRISLEMFTGMPLSVAAQLQINMLVRAVPGITINNILPDPDTVVPMFWFRQEVRISEDYASQARLVLKLRYGVPYALYALTVIGVGLLIAGVVVLIKSLLRPRDAALVENSENREE